MHVSDVQPTTQHTYNTIMDIPITEIVLRIGPVGTGEAGISLAYSLMSQAGDTLGTGTRPRGFVNPAGHAHAPSFGAAGVPGLPRPAPELHLPGASEAHAVPISGAHDSSLAPRPKVP